MLLNMAPPNGEFLHSSIEIFPTLSFKKLQERDRKQKI